MSTAFLGFQGVNVTRLKQKNLSLNEGTVISGGANNPFYTVPSGRFAAVYVLRWDNADMGNFFLRDDSNELIWQDALANADTGDKYPDPIYMYAGYDFGRSTSFSGTRIFNIIIFEYNIP